MEQDGKKVKIGLLGARGYTAGKLLQLLARHPGIQLEAVCSRSDQGKPISEVHPVVRGHFDLGLEEFDAKNLANRCDLVFSCLPHAASAESVKALIENDCRVIDFSADFRLNDLQTYKHWYQTDHPMPERVGATVYGLPELFRQQIQSADLVANPGCFPTSAIVPLAPLIGKGLVEAEGIIVDSKSGVSGAGRQSSEAFSFCEINEATAAYKVGEHRHMPEIEHILGRYSDKAIQVIFTPHLSPMNYGILSTIYAIPKGQNGSTVCYETLKEFYADEPFVDVVKDLPKSSDVVGTNRIAIAVRRSRDRIVIVSCIDNLIKGASGAAVQNFNLMFGFPENTGLN